MITTVDDPFKLIGSHLGDKIKKITEKYDKTNHTGMRWAAI